MKKQSTIFLVSAVLVFLFAIRLEAQEAVSQTAASPEAKQELSRGVPIAMIANGRSNAGLSQQVLGQETLKSKNEVGTTLPFPVAVPGKIIYPRKAIRKGWEGQTIVATEVLADGSVGRTALAKSSGHEILDAAAQDAVKTWKFAFESNKCDAVPQYVDIPVTFKLEDLGEG